MEIELSYSGKGRLSSHVKASIKRYRRNTYQRLFERGPRTRVLIFSSDPDLAHSLSLLLENRFDVLCETNIEQLERRILEGAPQLLLLDLFSGAPDTLRRIEVVKNIHITMPIVLLRGYGKASPDIEREIRNLTTWIFYKPINGELISEVLETALAEQKQES